MLKSIKYTPFLYLALIIAGKTGTCAKSTSICWGENDSLKITVVGSMCEIAQIKSLRDSEKALLCRRPLIPFDDDRLKTSEVYRYVSASMVFLPTTERAMCTTLDFCSRWCARKGYATSAVQPYRQHINTMPRRVAHDRWSHTLLSPSIPRTRSHCLYISLARSTPKTSADTMAAQNWNPMQSLWLHTH